VPAGAALAVLMERSDLPGRRALRGLTVLTLFVPLPLLATAWQAALGPARPGPDLAAAVAVHALAGLPWAVWLVGLGLRWVERDAEEDALLAAGPAAVLAGVTLPRAALAVAAAALLVAVQAADEITVTDLFQVRTFAEEVYSQFVQPRAAA